MARKSKFDWFLPGMVIAILAAAVLPEPGARGGALHPELLTKAGVALIFFLHGLGISFAALKAGTMNWKLHLVVQSTTFVVFPIIGWLALSVVDLAGDLELGFFFLCALPSTVSSSVAMTAAAHGNVAAAIFNATLSSLLGVFLTPLWMALLMKTAGARLPLADVLLDLTRWLIVPLVLGQISRPWLAAWAARHRKLIHTADRGTILLLVYTSFCDSMVWGVWSGKGTLNVAYAFVGSVFLFWLVFAIVRSVCRMFELPWPDRIAGIFCGSKKTLASGIPMAQLMFGSHPGLSLILLPIIIYHPMQLVICAALANRWAKRPPAS